VHYMCGEQIVMDSLEMETGQLSLRLYT